MSHSHITGNHQIDQQHLLLLQLIAKLEDLCDDKPERFQEQSACGIERLAPCSCACCASKIEACAEQLTDLLSDLLSYMLEHFAYEERLMRLLPQNEVCKDHIEKHTKAHADISRMLCKLAESVDPANPRASAVHLHGIVREWMGAHTLAHDNGLASELQSVYRCEIDLDVALARLLSMPAES